jgi:hypothetical protein
VHEHDGRGLTDILTGQETPMDMAPRTPTEHHYDLAESGLADLGGVGFDDVGRTVEVLVALTHATLAIAAMLATEDNHGRP